MVSALVHYMYITPLTQSALQELAPALQESNTMSGGAVWYSI